MRLAAAMLASIVMFGACANQRFASAPKLSADNVVNAADQRGGGVAPGEIVVLFPSNAGPPNLAEWPTIFPRTASDLEYMKRQPQWASIGGTRVFFDSVAAQIVYSVKGQVEAIVPYEVSNRKTTEVALEYEGVRSPPVRLPVVSSAPAIFALDASGKGQAAMLNETGCCNSPRNPATRGTIASLYATGEGRIPAPVKVAVGGTPAEILFADNVGELVVNFRVPLDAPAGDAIPLVLTVGSSRSPDGVTMAVRSSIRGVLVIEHEPEIRDRIAATLKKASYDVWEAKQQAAGHPIDLLITDLETPPKTLEIIRSEHPQVKIIITVREASSKVLRAADISGAEAVLEMPLVPEVLLRRVHDLLEERPARY